MKLVFHNELPEGYISHGCLYLALEKYKKLPQELTCQCDSNGSPTHVGLKLNSEKNGYTLIYNSKEISFKIEAVKNMQYGGNSSYLKNIQRFYILIPDNRETLNQISRDDNFDLLGSDD